ncbi:MAG: hypothetical protein FJ308_11410 [Planctomycetes bacterium]|nr:hypothetical protein [Planctomycetota bacterium]
MRCITLFLDVFPMQTKDSVEVEYRCQKCWNSNVASSENIGDIILCAYCRQPKTVPDATAERVERALQSLERQPQLSKAAPKESQTHFIWIAI